MLRSNSFTEPWYGGSVAKSTYIFGSTGLSPQRTFIVDMNALQSSLLAHELMIQPSSRFVVPDIAFIEMCKHVDCRRTMRLALNIFSKHQSQLYAAISVSEALRNEMNTLRAIQGEELVSLQFTNVIRNIVIDLMEDDDQLNNRIQADFEFERNRLLQQELNAEEARLNSVKMMQLTQEALDPRVIMALRKTKLARVNFLALVQWMAENLFLIQLKKKSGMSENAARDLLTKRPMYLRYHYLLVRRGLLMLKGGGNIPSDAAKELNTHLDMDYVMLASYFDGLISHDKGVNEAYSDLLTLLSTPMLGSAPDSCELVR